MNLLIVLIIGGIAGWLAGTLIRGKGYGIIIDILLGLTGAWLGSWLSEQLHLKFAGKIGYFITAVIGAVIIVSIVRLLKKGK